MKSFLTIVVRVRGSPKIVSVFMVAFPLLQFAICYIGAYLSQNALYKFLEEDMDQAHGQNSYVSD